MTDSNNEPEVSEGIERRLQNLKSWKPGQSGNPNGRPKGAKNFKTVLRETLDAYKEDFAGQEIDGVQKLAITLLRKAIFEKDGDLAAIREVLDRLEGKPIQNINQRTEVNDDKLSKAVDNLQQLLNKDDSGPTSNP